MLIPYMSNYSKIGSKMQKLFFRFTFIFVFLCFNLFASTETPSINDFFEIESVRLMMKPLQEKNKHDAWRVENTGENEKFVVMFSDDNDEEAPEEKKMSFVFRTQANVLRKPWKKLQDKDWVDSITKGLTHKLYLGVYERPEQNQTTRHKKLVGVVNLYGFPDVGGYLWMEYMFDTSSRGKGYGTEAIQTLTDFLKQQKLIPQEETDETIHYRGLKAKVDWQNKPSLAVLYKKCAFKAVSFHGTFIELEYPNLIKDTHDTHNLLKPLLDKHLGLPSKTENPASKVENPEPIDSPKKELRLREKLSGSEQPAKILVEKKTQEFVESSKRVLRPRKKDVKEEKPSEIPLDKENIEPIDTSKRVSKRTKKATVDEPSEISIEEQLVRLSFANLLAQDTQALTDSFAYEDYDFVMETLTKFSDLYETITKTHQQILHTLLSKHFKKEYIGFVSDGTEDGVRFAARKRNYQGVIRKLNPKSRANQLRQKVK